MIQNSQWTCRLINENNQFLKNEEMDWKDVNLRDEIKQSKNV